MSQGKPSSTSSRNSQKKKNFKKEQGYWQVKRSESKSEESTRVESVEGDDSTDNMGASQLSSSFSSASANLPGPLSSSFFSRSHSPVTEKKETKETKASDEDLLALSRSSGKSELEMWRTAVLSLTPVEEIAKLVSAGFDLNLALHAAMTQQFVMMTQQHQDSIINALLAHANINHLATAVADGKVRLARLLATHLGAKGRLDDPILKGEYAGASVLCMAADMGLLPMVRLLLAAGAKPNTESPVKGTTQTAFKVATERGYWEIVEELLKAGVSVHTKWSGVTAIYSAAADGHLALVKLLITAGADCSAPLGDDAAPQHGRTPLYAAAATGHGAVVKVLAEDKSRGGGGAPHNQPMTSGLHAGKTPLMIACERGHKSVVRALLKLGVNSEEPHFSKALAAAKRGNHTAITESLEIFHSYPGAREAKTILPLYEKRLYEAQAEDFFTAMAEDEDPAVDMAKEIIASARKRKTKLKEPYAMEKLFGHEDMSELSLYSVRKLHDLLDDLMLEPQKLRLANIIQYIRKPDVFRFLCNWGWDIHARDKAGHTSAILSAAAIHMPQLSVYKPVEDQARVRVTPEIIRLLLNRGADPNDQNPLPTSIVYNYSHATPLQMSLYGEGKERETKNQILLDAGADIDQAIHIEGNFASAPYYHGYTVLLHAIRRLDPEAVQMLVALNADIYKKTEQGSTAWSLCRSYSEGYVSSETRLQIKNCLDNKDIDNWRHVAAVMNPAYARESINLLLQAGAHLSTIIVPAPALQDPARISTAPQTALYWLTANYSCGLEIFSPAILQEYRINLLYEAATHGNIKLLEYTLSRLTLGKPISDTNMSKAVYYSAKYGHHQAIEMLIKAGSPFNKPAKIRNDDDVEDESAPAWTPLCVAAWFGHTRAVELLIRRTKKPNEAVNTLDAPLSLDTHPLALAAAGGHLAMVKLLLAANAKVDARAGAAPTALAYAVKRAVQYPSIDALTIIKLLLAAGADRNITYTDPKLKKKGNNWRKIATLDILNHYKLICEDYLALPLWSHRGEGVAQFYEEIRACLRLPVEDQLHKLLGDLITRDLIIKVLAAKVAFPPGYRLTPPQGNLPGSVEMPAPAAILRELLGLVASHHKIATPPLYGKMYYEDLVMLSQTLAEESDSPAVTLAGEELARLEDVITKLYKMHLQLLAPEVARFQATGAKSEDKPKLRENKSTTSGAKGVNWFQPAGLPAAPSSQRNYSASSSVSTLTPKKGN